MTNMMMDNFSFIADKLRGIPLVSGGRADQDKEQLTSVVQLEKRDVSSSSQEGILFKSAGITASTSNFRRQTVAASQKKQTTAKLPTTTTTTRRPPTRTSPASVSRSTSDRKQQAAAPATTTTTTRKPMTRQLNSGNHLKQQQVASSARPATLNSAQQNTSASSREATTAQPSAAPPSSSGSAAEETTATTMKKFDKLIDLNSQDQQQQPARGSIYQEVINLGPARSITPATASASAATAAHLLPLVTQSFNQRRTLQPMLGPQRFNDGKSLSAGPNWVAFNRPDGGFSFFEILVLLSSIIMVSTIVFVILSNWVKSFRRKRAKEAPREAGSGSAAAILPPLSSAGSGGADGTRKISTISSGALTTASELTSSTACSAPANSHQIATNPRGPTVIDMPTTAAPVSSMIAAAQVNGAPKLVDSLQQQLIGASLNISSEIKQAAGNISNKATAIVQPTENNNRNTTKKQQAAANHDSISVMSDPTSADHKLAGGDKMTTTTADPQAKKNINRSASDLSAANLNSSNKKSFAADDRGEQPKAGTVLLEELFNSSAASDRSQAATSKAPPAKESKSSDVADKKQAAGISRVGSLESIELPPTLVESIGRQTNQDGGAKALAPDEAPAPSPNLLLGEREPGGDKLATPTNSQPEHSDPPRVDSGAKKPAPTNREETSVATSKKADENKSSASGKPTQKQAEKILDQKNQKSAGEQRTRPDNPMGRDKPAAATTRTAEVKNHQVVVNKLDKRRTNLEIVDLRDESVTGKMRTAKDTAEPRSDSSTSSAAAAAAAGNWISMDGVAVVQAAAGGHQQSVSNNNQQVQLSPEQLQQLQEQHQQMALMSPSEIIESRFHVDYKGKRRGQLAGEKVGSKDSADSKATDYLTNNIESELEQDNRMHNRKYFVYVVHDGHFTAKKECIARIELPPKRRITLAEMRQLIANSQDISLTSLRRNRFKFVTETYRLLNENEDATILHQVYPTQGVFLKLNIPEQENQAYALKSRTRPAAGRLSTGSGSGAGLSSSAAGAAMASSSSLANATIASRRRAGGSSGSTRQLDAGLPAIEVDGYALSAQDRARASSVGRRNRQPTQGGSYRRSKSSVVGQNRSRQPAQATAGSYDRLPSIGRSEAAPTRGRRELAEPTKRQHSAPRVDRPQVQVQLQLQQRQRRTRKAATIGEAANDLGQNVLSGAKKLLGLDTLKL